MKTHNAPVGRAISKRSTISRPVRKNISTARRAPRKETKNTTEIVNSARHLTIEQVQQVLSAAKRLGITAYTLVLTVLITGIRLRELRTLNFENIDFENNILSIRNTVGTMIRNIPLIQIDQLNDYFNTRKELRTDSNTVFINKRGKSFHSVSINYICRNISRISGIHFTTHMLRYTFGAQLVYNGAPLTAVRYLLGIPSSRSMVPPTYTTEDLHEIMQKHHPLSESFQSKSQADVCEEYQMQ